MRPQLYSSGFLVFRHAKNGRQSSKRTHFESTPQSERTPRLEFLLMKHSERWDLPKGHLDLSESKMQAAILELWEETGIREDFIQIDPDFAYTNQYWVNYDGVKRLKELTIFLAILCRDWEIEPTEHLGFQWFPFLPPHAIQSETIDPLLEQVAMHFTNRPFSGTVLI